MTIEQLTPKMDFEKFKCLRIPSTQCLVTHMFDFDQN